jgi:hypothetical protein
LQETRLTTLKGDRNALRGLKFHDIPERGSGNRMVGIHPVGFIANLLDPWFRLCGLDVSQADQKNQK